MKLLLGYYLNILNIFIIIYQKQIKKKKCLTFLLNLSTFLLSLMDTYVQFFFSINTFFIHLLVYQILYLHYVYNFFYTIIYNIIYSILEKLHFAF